MQLPTIVLTGPESTGKTTLANQLASHFQTSWVPEFARTYIDNLGRPYTEADLLEIARGQITLENRGIHSSNKPVFLDTSLEVIKIWSMYKYNHCHPWIIEQNKLRKHALYLLCKPDIPWQKDPQRENPGDRLEIFNLYLQELTEQNTNFVLISGLKEKRFTDALHHVKPYIHISRSSYHA